MVEQAHRVGLPLVAHAHSLLGVRNALAAGADGIEHFSCLSRDGIVISDELLEDVARRGVAIDLTLGNDRSLHHLMPAPPPPVAELMARWVSRASTSSTRPGSPFSHDCVSTGSG
jgi:imidazolonepropionase-like amidohydrolase